MLRCCALLLFACVPFGALAAPVPKEDDTARMLRAAADGHIQVLVLLGADPIVDFPDGALARQAIERVGFVIAVDAFVTDSTRRADVFLPCTLWGEKTGTITNLELTRMILRLTKSKSTITHRPHPGAEIELRVPSIHKAADLLGFAPRVGLEEGLTRTIAWYAENLAGVKA